MVRRSLHTLSPAKDRADCRILRSTIAAYTSRGKTQLQVKSLDNGGLNFANETVYVHACLTSGTFVPFMSEATGTVWVCDPSIQLHYKELEDKLVKTILFETGASSIVPALGFPLLGASINSITA